MGILFFSLLTISGFSQKREIIYYNQSWHGCSEQEAAFYRIAIIDKNGKSIGRITDYYISGEVQSMIDSAIFIDRNNDINSTWVGKCIGFYKSGKKQFEVIYDNLGKRSSYRSWNENGEEDYQREKSIYYYGDFHGNLAAIKDENNKWGFIDKTGNIVIPTIYTDYFYPTYGDGYGISFSEDLAAVGNNNKYGFINKLGQVVIPFIYDGAYNFSEGLALVNSKGFWGFIDKKNNIVVPFKYTLAYSFKNGLAAVTTSQGNYGQLIYGFINKKGQEIFPQIFIGPWTGKAYEDILVDFHMQTFSDSICFVDHPTKGCCIINTNGNIISSYNLDSSLEFSCSSQFTNQLAPIRKNGLVGYINKRLNVVIPCVFEDGSLFSENYASVKINGKYGFINTQGALIIPCIYDEMYSRPVFSEGLACVKMNGKYGAIDISGRVIIPFDYDYSEFTFSNGVARVFSKGQSFFIDKENRKIFDCK